MMQPTQSLDLWRIRLYFFLWFGAGGFLIPFITLFYKARGLSGSEIGLLSAIGWTVSLLIAPLWGRWSDARRDQRRLLQAGLLGSAACILVLSQQRLFVWMVIIIAVESLASAAIEPLSNVQALAITRGDKWMFGSVRLWGSLGWALTAPLCGWLIERLGLTSAFVGYAAAALAGALTLQFVSLMGGYKVQEGEPRLPLRVVLAGLAKNRLMAGLAVTLFLLWLSGAGRQQFESIYMTQLGAKEGVIGMLNTVGALIELPAMLWADRLVGRFGSGRIFGLSLVMQFAATATVVIAPSIPSIFILRAASGVYFSLYTAASIAYTTEGAPAQQRATVLTLYYTTLRGIVILIASPLSGIAFDWLGAYPLYVIAMVGTFLAWLVFVISRINKPVLSRPMEV